MSTDRETTRVVRSWLEEGVTALPDRVLDAVLDQVPATPQRRPWWPARRSDSMNTYAKLIGAAAAVLLVAVVGYQFLPRNGGIGGQPTIAPSPSPVPLAAGSFLSHGGQIELYATGEGSSVTGTMVYADPANRVDRFVIDLACARTTPGGLIQIGGTVTESKFDSEPKGSRVAIVLQRGSPVNAIIHSEYPDPPFASCQAFLQSIPDVGDPAFMSVMEPIEGTIDIKP